MNETPPDKDPDHARREQATRWMARMLSGDVSKKDRLGFNAWLTDPANKAAYNALEAAVARHDPAGETLLAEMFEQELNALAESAEPARAPSIQAEAQQAAPIETTPVRPKPASTFLPGKLSQWSIAASLGALVLIVGVLLASSPSPSIAEYATARGEQAGHQLQDGSQITLNTNSALEVRYSKRERRAALTRGEAFFDIAAENDRPFTVDTSLGEVSVLGTSFNIHASQDQLAVSVVSGVVDVAPRTGAPVQLTAGERLTVSKSGNASAVERFNPQALLAWREGKSRYDGKPLSAVIKDLNRYFSTPVALGESALGELPVTGEFDVTDQETTLQALTIAFNLRKQIAADRIILLPHEPTP